MGECRQQSEPEPPRALVPRRSHTKNTTQEPAPAFANPRSLLGFPFPLPLSLTHRAPSSPGVCTEEGRWEGKRQVYLVPQGLGNPLLFFPSFLIREALPQPGAGPRIGPSFSTAPTPTTPLALLDYPIPPPFLSTIKVGAWRSRDVWRAERKQAKAHRGHLRSKGLLKLGRELWSGRGPRLSL